MALAAAVWLGVPTASLRQSNTAIRGTWRGTSTCVDRQHFPACTDELVIYEVRAHASAPDSVVVAADKVVNGVRESMGELAFGRAADSTWVGEFPSRRGRGRWTLRIAGDRMTGQLVEVNTGYHVRRVALTRQR